MKRYRIVAGALLLALTYAGLPNRSSAHVPGPVCRSPNVVRVMARELDDRAAYSVLEPSLIAQTPSQDPRIVRCDLCLPITWYDTPRFGDLMLVTCEPHTF